MTEKSIKTLISGLDEEKISPKDKIRVAKNLSLERRIVLTSGIIGALSRLYHGPAEHFIHEYGFNILAPFAMTLAFRSPNPRNKKSLVPAAIGITAFCYALEVSEHFGIYGKVFGSQYQDWNFPGDFLAYPIGAAAAVGLNKIMKKRGK